MELPPGVEPLRPSDPGAVGAYRILGVIGEGGMGVVYLARHDGEPVAPLVALKLVHPRHADDPGFRDRFRDEVANARRVSPFCTAQVLDQGQFGLRPYMVTEYIQGISLARRLGEQGPLPPAELQGVAAGVAAALSAIHAAGLVHRDLKPANVLLSMAGPRVIDFGIARALDEKGGRTEHGLVIGTPGWIAPERLSGRSGPAGDVWAWGCLVAYAATGRHPFDEGPGRDRTRTPSLGLLPPPLDELVPAALAADPRRRPTARRLVDRLHSSPARPSGERPNGRSRLRRRGVVIGLTALGTAAVLAGGTLAVVAIGDSPPDEVKVGFLGALSGEYSTLVANARNGTLMAIEERNRERPGPKVTLTSYDTGAGVARLRKSVDLVKKIDEDRVAAVIGSPFSDESARAGEALDADGIPAVSPSATDPELTSKGWRYWHRTIAPSTRQATGIADLLGRAFPRSKAFIAYEDDTAYRVPAEDARIAFERYGLPVESAAFVGETADSTARRIAEARAKIVLYLGGATSGQRLMDAIRKRKARPLLAGDDESLGLRGRGIEGPDAEGMVIGCTCLLPYRGPGLTLEMEKFRERYRARFGAEPGFYSVEGYMAAQTVLAAVKAGRTGRDQINSYLGSAQVPVLGRTVKFDARGDLADPPVYVYRRKRGTIELLGDSRSVPPTAVRTPA
ncbi:ABC transporter substrate-binding protein [Actinomadura sp. NPDC000600]|uniref:bifunctional serine/threonine-protein kinase/ABC transporter substrate-binding protein n=1 Tax=Actinomadura sp. NPDC000600 TaxID=3154262 RepID=UPI0033962A62